MQTLVEFAPSGLIVIKDESAYGTTYLGIEDKEIFSVAYIRDMWVKTGDIEISSHSPLMSFDEKIHFVLSPSLTIEVYASGGEMGGGTIDNNLTYFLDPHEAMEHLKYEYFSCWEPDGIPEISSLYRNEEQVNPDDINTDIDWDAVRSDVAETGTVFEAYGYSYGINLISMPLVDYLQLEEE